MFGFSFQKILVLIVIIVVVWYGFKAAGRIKAKREKQVDGDKASGSIDSQDMVKCAACGHYLAADKLVNCGRDDCPYS
ncbi:MAG: hypothetical protein HON62_10930 [Rhodospirillaceae bacterium]|jgi:capsule polysaccharide export protein KpsE/RkpR|nr:hypothetical protein [Rhodospirillaceae bacterium]MBT6442561.1 hypothetical protein [Alphaproteobacteria bacterium]